MSFVDTGETDTSTAPVAPPIDQFRAAADAFIADAAARGDTCPAFGAILPPHLHERARRWQRSMADAGFAALHWPAEHGGRGLDRSYTAAWREACATTEVSPYINLQGIVLAAEAIIRSGTNQQQARLLPDTASGDVLWCQLFSEPDAGSDLASLRATATPTGDGGYRISGQKVWCSNGQFAEWGILLARTGDPGHRGITFFLLDMSLPGVDVRPMRQITGDEEFTEVFLDDVELPSDAVLGDIDDGWNVAMAVLSDERGGAGDTSGLISLDRRLTSLASMMNDDPVQRDELMRLIARGHALRAMLLRSAGNPAAASASKLLRTELEFDAAELTTRLTGAESMLDNNVTDHFLYSPGMKIAGGSSEIQRNIIGERILGLPREPRPSTPDR